MSFVPKALVRGMRKRYAARSSMKDFRAKAAGREKAPYSGLFASHGSVAVTRKYRTTAGRQTDFAGLKMTATRPKAPIIQGSRDTGT
jgi:hypothetical protein